VRRVQRTAVPSVEGGGVGRGERQARDALTARARGAKRGERGEREDGAGRHAPSHRRRAAISTPSKDPGATQGTTRTPAADVAAGGGRPVADHNKYPPAPAAARPAMPRARATGPSTTARSRVDSRSARFAPAGQLPAGHSRSSFEMSLALRTSRT